MHFERSVRTRLVVAALAAWMLSCASGHPAGPPLQEPPPGEREPYVIGPTDRLQIAVWKNPELGVSVPVRSDGKISVPLLDDVQAEGLTAEELKEVLTQELSEYVAAPDVTVIVIEMNSRTASVMGGVGASGMIPVQKQVRVLEAISIMGGFSPYGRKNDVRILRRTDDGIVEYHFHYDDYVSGKAPDSNLILKPGDHVVVPD